MTSNQGIFTVTEENETRLSIEEFERYRRQVKILRLGKDDPPFLLVGDMLVADLAVSDIGKSWFSGEHREKPISILGSARKRMSSISWEDYGLIGIYSSARSEPEKYYISGLSQLKRYYISARSEPEIYYIEEAEQRRREEQVKAIEELSDTQRMKAIFGGLFVLCIFGAIASLVAMLIVASREAPFAFGGFCALAWLVLMIGRRTVDLESSKQQ